MASTTGGYYYPINYGVTTSTTTTNQWLINGGTNTTGWNTINYNMPTSFRALCAIKGGKVSKKKPTGVYKLTEGSWFIRGALSLGQAKDLLLQDDEAKAHIEHLRSRRGLEDVDVDLLLKSTKNGFYRFTPCGNWCEDHKWHLLEAKKPGHGVFFGMEIETLEIEEIEDDGFESDPWVWGDEESEEKVDV